MQQIPLKAVPSQELNVTLGNQPCSLKIYEKFFGLYIDVYLNGSLIIGGVAAENLNRIVRSTYLGFSGDLIFADAEGTDDPDYTGLDTRFFLFWLTPDDLIALQLTG